MYKKTYTIWSDFSRFPLLILIEEVADISFLTNLVDYLLTGLDITYWTMFPQLMDT